jgi:general secretion pathway protein F
MIERATYAYRAVRGDGAQEVGVIEAPSRDAAVARLAGRGLFPIEVRPELAGRVRGWRGSASDLALGLRTLATLLESGMPLSRALAAMVDLAPGPWRAGIPAVQEAVREGEGLGAALRDSPIAPPEVIIGVIQAGEAGSGLAAAVRRAAELAEASAATRAAIRAALAYPLLLAGAAVASVGLLVGVVLPRFASILADLGQTVPPTTRIVLGIAGFVRASALPSLLAFALTAVAWRTWVEREDGRVRWHAFLLSVPWIGGIRRAAATSRVCAALAALLETGVPISAALAHGARAAGDAALAARLMAAREAILGGQGIARSLAAADAVTPAALHLIRTGEAAGSLAAMLSHAARLEAERAERLTRAAVRVLEPALIILMAGIVALVAAALLQAVYGIRPAP